MDEIDVTMQPLAHQDVAGLIEAPPGTNLNAVTAEYVFLSGEPGFDWDDESMSLEEEPSPGTTLNAVTAEYVFPNVADYDGEFTTLGDGM